MAKYLEVVQVVNENNPAKEVTLYTEKTKYRFYKDQINVTTRRSNGYNATKQYTIGFDKLPKTLEKLVEEVNEVKLQMVDNVHVIVEWNNKVDNWKNGNPYNLPF